MPEPATLIPRVDQREAHDAVVSALDAGIAGGAP
jgi:hypothetical protein